MMKPITLSATIVYDPETGEARAQLAAPDDLDPAIRHAIQNATTGPLDQLMRAVVRAAGGRGNGVTHADKPPKNRRLARA